MSGMRLFFTEGYTFGRVLSERLCARLFTVFIFVLVSTAFANSFSNFQRDESKSVEAPS